MTLPVSQGYPDWARSSDESTTLEINDNPVSHTGIFDYPIRYVGNAKAFRVYAQPLSGSARFDFQFFADPAGNFQGGSFQIDCQLNDQAVQAVPVLGPYMNVEVTPDAGGLYSYTLMVWHMPSLQSESVNLPGFVGISQDSIAVAAGGSVSLRSPWVYACDAVWWFSYSGTSYIIDVHALDYLGNPLLLARQETAAGTTPPQQTLFCPAASLEVTMENHDAAPKTFDLRLSRRPYWTG